MVNERAIDDTLEQGTPRAEIASRHEFCEDLAELLRWPAPDLQAGPGP